MTTPDPVTLSVLDNRFRAIVEEMGEAMLRTVLFADPEFLARFLDRALRCAGAPGRAGRPHPGPCGRHALRGAGGAGAFGDAVREGDVYLLNDPYHGGTHLPDLTAFVPVFAEGRIVFWSVVRAHHTDIGGATHGAYNPAATEIWQEGLRIPPILLGQGRVAREDLVRMIATNTRQPREFRGDLMAMIGAAHLGERRLLAVLGKYGAAPTDRGGRGHPDAVRGACAAHRRDLEGWRVPGRGVPRR